MVSYLSQLVSPLFVSYPGTFHSSLLYFIKAVPINQKIYFLGKVILVFSLIALLLKNRGSLPNPFSFLILASLTILFFRLPNTLLPEQNLDESVYIAGAGIILNDPKIWQSFDCLTVGPFNSYLLSLSYWIFGTICYTTIRLIGILCCTIPSMICLYFAMLFLYGRPIAYCITLGYALFNAILTTFDFIGFSSELFPHLLLSLEFLCFSAILSGRSFSYAYLLCFTAGLVPYAKLQGVLLAGLLVVFLFIEIRKQVTIRKTIGLIGCGLAPTVVLIIYLYTNSLVDDFVFSYLKFNLEYSGNLTNLRWNLIPELILDSPDISLFVISIILISSVSALYLFTLKSFSKKYLIVYCLLILAVIWYSIIKPGQFFNHYLVFLFFPIFWMLGIVSGEIQKIKPARFPIYLTSLYILFFGLTALSLPKKNIGIDYAFGATYKPNALVSTIQALAKPTDRMSIWGHGNLAHLHCYTSLLPGTRDVFASRQINPSPLQSYFIERYKKDLYQNRPRFILEDTKYEHYQTQLQAAFPALNQFYELHSQHGSINVYVRKNGAIFPSISKTD